MNRSALKTEKLTLAYGQSTIIDNLTLSLPKGKISVLVGSNGCGKSTLLRSLARLMKPHQGNILLDGKSIHHQSTKKLAQNLAILPQSPIAPEGLTVQQLVKQGRYPYQSWRKQWSHEDERCVAWALQVTHMEEYKDRTIDALSGGQRQRAWIAMVLAQDTDIILLDEPTTYLDMAHQIEVLDLLFELNEMQNKTIIMVLHDLNLACRYADYMVAIKDRGVFAQGHPEEIVDEDMVKEVFHMKCQISFDPIFGTPLCVPYGKGRTIRQAPPISAVSGS
ncbi:ABC transporter ATP-binding protein [Mechercharimyces sp. CAU 1602]|uniref:ABC transporter ATP-binding protein n=1 Tax=Mechercharimyces sp. CAU 1602 TaxID=2973933 RepID=UPI002162BC74|nr:ABC transporter ATP-binding protein [Mechercharimyces sp. CAU 1602]MCS1352835.1 ABC transporter ATP-binding protein [Mechercharimyces sp. CAU 1602]